MFKKIALIRIRRGLVQPHQGTLNPVRNLRLVIERRQKVAARYVDLVLEHERDRLPGGSRLQFAVKRADRGYQTFAAGRKDRDRISHPNLA